MAGIRPGDGTAGRTEVREVRRDGPVPLYLHPDWAERFEWLVQGTTVRGADDDFDLRLSGGATATAALGRWRLLREGLRMPRAVLAGQVHGTHLIRHHSADPAGLLITDQADGHLTAAEGVLLAVTVADCIPISIVDPARRALALLHGGWRGVAAGIVEAGIAALRELAGSGPADLLVHLGPAICGRCYEVGTEVFSALGLKAPSGNQPIDLRAVAARRAEEVGVPAEAISISTFCTRCEASPFFSYRAGSEGRQVGVLGIRPGGAGGGR